jgi:hypothetical protein
VASQVILEVVISADNADFSGLDDDGIDDGAEPCLAGFDFAIGQPPDQFLGELLDDRTVDGRLFSERRLAEAARDLRWATESNSRIAVRRRA